MEYESHEQIPSNQYYSQSTKLQIEVFLGVLWWPHLYLMHMFFHMSIIMNEKYVFIDGIACIYSKKIDFALKNREKLLKLVYLELL